MGPGCGTPKNYPETGDMLSLPWHGVVSTMGSAACPSQSWNFT